MHSFQDLHSQQATSVHFSGDGLLLNQYLTLSNSSNIKILGTTLDLCFLFIHCRNEIAFKQ